MTDSAVISVSALNFRYPQSQTPTLIDINMQCFAGQCHGLIGPNGAGKSTLLSLLCGLLQGAEGQLLYQGQGSLTIGQFVQKAVSLVPQEYAFYSRLSCLENLKFFAALCPGKNTKQRIGRVVAQCALQSVLNKPAEHLSGGYKRRLNLAIGLLKDPQILFLDEPTVGVDPRSRQAIGELIQTLKAQGKTLVFTSHLLTEVEQLCDQVSFLQAGQCYALEAEPSSKSAVVRLVCPVSQADLEDLMMDFPLIERKGNELHLPDCQQQQLALLLNRLSEQQQIHSVHFAPPALQQRYLSSVGNQC